MLAIIPARMVVLVFARKVEVRLALRQRRSRNRGRDRRRGRRRRRRLRRRVALALVLERVVQLSQRAMFLRGRAVAGVQVPPRNLGHHLRVVEPTKDGELVVARRRTQGRRVLVVVPRRSQGRRVLVVVRRRSQGRRVLVVARRRSQGRRVLVLVRRRTEQGRGLPEGERQKGGAHVHDAVAGGGRALGLLRLQVARPGLI